MKRKYLAIAIIITSFAIACNSGSGDSQNTKDSIVVDPTEISQNSPNAAPSILGVWRLENDDATSFEVKKDTIYYFDQGKQYKYDLKGDSITIYYDDWKYRGKIKRDNNRLTITDSLNESKYIQGNN